MRLKIYALEKEKAIYHVAYSNIQNKGLIDRIIPVLGEANSLPFENEFADFIITRGTYHFWEYKLRVFREIYRVLKKGGIGFDGGGICSLCETSLLACAIHADRTGPNYA